MRTEYIEVDLRTVLKYYVDGFEPRKKGESVYIFEPFVDTAKNIVVFRLTIKEEGD